MARYGKKAGTKVKRAMHELEAGTLRSGRSKKKVKSRKQAIAIGLSEARKKGKKVPKKAKAKPKASEPQPTRRSSLRFSPAPCQVPSRAKPGSAS